MRKIKKSDLEDIVFKVEDEGMDYCFTQYSNWEEETKGTVLAPLITKYQIAYDELSDAISELKKEYKLDEEYEDDDGDEDESE